jgi:hypothetical protein
MNARYDDGCPCFRICSKNILQTIFLRTASLRHSFQWTSNKLSFFYYQCSWVTFVMSLSSVYSLCFFREKNLLQGQAYTLRGMEAFQNTAQDTEKRLNNEIWKRKHSLLNHDLNRDKRGKMKKWVNYHQRAAKLTIVSTLPHLRIQISLKNKWKPISLLSGDALKV